jgi:hypothetical protein
MDNPDDRIAELIAAAVADELSADEAVELDALRRDHPWIDEELAQLRALAERVEQSQLDWIEVSADDGLRDRITRRPRRWLVPLVAAASLAVGLTVGATIPGALSAPPAGDPGTLGAVEELIVDDQSPGAQIEAELVAHTWGTEAILDATGLDVGATYSVVFIGTDGAEYIAGEMLGSDVPIHCRLNAAVLRQDAVRLEIREAGDPRLTAAADLPGV